jgi:hypothetical protein
MPVQQLGRQAAGDLCLVLLLPRRLASRPWARTAPTANYTGPSPGREDVHGLQHPGRHGQPGRLRQQLKKVAAAAKFRGARREAVTLSPRPDWKQKIEEQGLVFSTTTMDDGRKIEYWNESAYYEFTMDEVETLR